MENLYHAILENLYQFGVNKKEVHLNNWLDSYPHVNTHAMDDAQRVKNVLAELTKEKYITHVFRWQNQLNNWENDDDVKKNINDSEVNATLLIGGYKYIAEKIRQETQDGIFKKQSDSVIETNASVKTTNTLITEISKTQKNTAIAVAAFTAVLMITGIATFLKPTDKLQQNTLQVSPDMRLLLDSALKVQKEIDSSLRLMAKKTDTVYVKLR